jgi:hypothetical protein
MVRTYLQLFEEALETQRERERERELKMGINWEHIGREKANNNNMVKDGKK